MCFGGNNESERAMNMLHQLAFPGQKVLYAEEFAFACEFRKGA